MYHPSRLVTHPRPGDQVSGRPHDPDVQGDSQCQFYAAIEDSYRRRVTVMSSEAAAAMMVTGTNKPASFRQQNFL